MSRDRRDLGGIESGVSGPIAIVHRGELEHVAPPELLTVPARVLDAFKIASTPGEGRPAIRVRGSRDPGRTLVLLQLDGDRLVVLRLHADRDGWLVATMPRVPDGVALAVFVVEFETASDIDAVESQWRPREAETTEGPGREVDVGGDARRRMDDVLRDALEPEHALPGDEATPFEVPRTPGLEETPWSTRPRGPIAWRGAEEAGEQAEAAEAVEEAAEEATAAEPSPEGPIRGGAPPREVLAHLQGEMPGTVVVDRPFPVRFALSRKPISSTPGFRQHATVAIVNADRAVWVTIVPRGFRMSADEPRTVKLELPESDDAVEDHHFTLVATRPGLGEVVLIVRQGADLPLATLRLTAEAVTDGVAEAAPRPVVAAVTPPDRALLALPSIRVDEELVDGRSTLSIRASIGVDEAEGTMHLDDKAGYVSRLYRRIDGVRAQLSRIHDTQRRAETAVRELSRLGRSVATDVLPRNVLDFLWTHRDELDGLIVQTTGEVDVPWEIVHLVPPMSDDDAAGAPTEDGRFLCRYGLTRWVYGTAHPTELHVSTERAHVICPAYKLERFRLQATEEERELLETKLRASAIHPDDAAAIRSIVTERYDLLHFAGHGHWATTAPPIQELLLSEFDDEEPRPDWRYSDEDLRADVPDLGTIPEDAEGPIVFLNACDLGRLPSGERSLGGFPEAFLRRGAAAFIGCSWSVGDDAAGSFVREFYAALIKEETLADATRHARAAAAQTADLSDLAFAVYAHPRARLHLT